MNAEPHGEIRHDAAKRRFETGMGASLAVLDYTIVDERTLDYRHTFVPPAERGRGTASRLVRFALDYALKHGLTVVPSCPFVATYIEGHPRYRPVLGH
jgi:predicted GNAT family acetyltransferase